MHFGTLKGDDNAADPAPIIAPVPAPAATPSSPVTSPPPVDYASYHTRHMLQASLSPSAASAMAASPEAGAAVPDSEVATPVLAPPAKLGSGYWGRGAICCGTVYMRYAPPCSAWTLPYCPFILGPSHIMFAYGEWARSAGHQPLLKCGKAGRTQAHELSMSRQN